MEGIKNFLIVVNDNWTTIVVICGVGISIYRKVKSYLKLSNEQKIKSVWKAVDSVVLSMVSDAELNYTDWKGAGELKRSEVVSRIFAEYPILSKITNADEVIRRIDDCIDNALITVKSVIEDNAAEQLVDNLYEEEDGGSNESDETSVD